MNGRADPATGWIQLDIRVSALHHLFGWFSTPLASNRRYQAFQLDDANDIDGAAGFTPGVHLIPVRVGRHVLKNGFGSSRFNSTIEFDVHPGRATLVRYCYGGLGNGFDEERTIADRVVFPHWGWFDPEVPWMGIVFATLQLLGCIAGGILLLRTDTSTFNYLPFLPLGLAFGAAVMYFSVRSHRRRRYTRWLIGPQGIEFMTKFGSGAIPWHAVRRIVVLGSDNDKAPAVVQVEGVAPNGSPIALDIRLSPLLVTVATARNALDAYAPKGLSID